MMPMRIAVCRGDSRTRVGGRGLRVIAALPLTLLMATAAGAQQSEFCVTCQGPDATYRCAFEGADASPARPGLQLHCISTLAREGRHASCSIGRATKAPCAGELKVLALPGAVPPGASPGAAIEAAGEAAPAAATDKPVQSTAVEPPQTDVEMQGVAQPAPAPALEPPPPPTKKAWNDNSGPAGEPAGPAGAPPEEAQTAEAKPDDAAAGEPQSDGLLKPLEGAGKAVGDAAKSTGEALGKAGEAVGSAAKKSWKCLTSLFGDC